MSAAAALPQLTDQAVGLPSLLVSSARRIPPPDGTKVAAGALLAPCTIGLALDKQPRAAPAAAAAPSPSPEQALDKQSRVPPVAVAAPAPSPEQAPPAELAGAPGGASRGAAGAEAPSSGRPESEQDAAFWTKATKALEDKARLEKVAAFLKKHGAEGVNHMVGWMNRRYPMHIAVEQNDAEMVQLLLDSDAKRRVYDSSGHTPLQLARTLNTMQGSHAAVLKVFAQNSVARHAAKKHRRSGAEAGPPSPGGSGAAAISRRTNTLAEHALVALKRSATASTSASTSAGTPGTGARATLRDAEAQCSFGVELPGDDSGAASSSPGATALLQRAVEEERALRLAAESELEALRQQVEHLEGMLAKSGGI